MLPTIKATGQDTLSQLSEEQLMVQGRQYFEQRQAAKALQCFSAVNSREGTDLHYKVRALNNMGCVYNYFLQDYIKGYDCLRQAYKLCDSLQFEEFLPVIMVNLGDLMNHHSLSTSSETLSKQSQELFENCIQRAVETQHWDLLTTAFFNLANQNYQLTLKNYRVIFDRQIPDSVSDLQFVRLMYLGMEQVQLGHYAEARELFLKQLPVVSARWEPSRDSISSYMSIAYTYQLEGDYTHQTAWLETALQLARERGDNEQAQIISHQLVESRAGMLDERQQLQQLVILAIGIALLIVLGSAILLWRKNRQLNVRNRALYEKNRQLLRTEQEEQMLRKNLMEQKYSHSNLSSEQKDILLYRIEDILHEPEAICQTEFTLAKLAKMADSNTTYVSQAINEHYGTSFSNVLSRMRIKEACRRINDEGDHYRRVTIEGIAAGVGFKSRTAFINAFKREVGLTPSEYLRMAGSK
jgi:AraC-like DNA-binding protein